MAYATVTDLEARWRTLSAVEREIAETLLGDAQIRLDAECPPADPLPAAQRQIRVIVSCEMVKRAMLNREQSAGVTSIQSTAGPFSKSLTYVNPTGDLYISKGERKLLGCGKQRAGVVDPLTHI